MYFIASDFAISILVKRNSAAIKTEIFIIELLRIKWYDRFPEFIYWTASIKYFQVSMFFSNVRKCLSLWALLVTFICPHRKPVNACLRELVLINLETIGRTDRLGGNIEYKQWVTIKETVTLDSFDKKHCKGVTFKSWAHEIDLRTYKGQITSIVNIVRINSWCETRTWWWTPWRNLW